LHVYALKSTSYLGTLRYVIAFDSIIVPIKFELCFNDDSNIMLMNRTPWPIFKHRSPFSNLYLAK